MFYNVPRLPAEVLTKVGGACPVPGAELDSVLIRDNFALVKSFYQY